MRSIVSVSPVKPTSNETSCLGNSQPLKVNIYVCVVNELHCELFSLIKWIISTDFSFPNVCTEVLD